MCKKVEASEKVGRVSLALSVVMIIALMVPATSTAADLVLHLPFDEGSGNITYDNSIYDHHGTVAGAVWVEGLLGHALEFDGINDYVQVGHTSALNVPGITMTCWINMASSMASKFGSPIHKRGCYHIDMQSLRFTANINTSVGDHWTFDGYLAPDQWYFLCVTYVEGDSLRLYVDGMQVASRSCSGIIAPGYTFDLFVGKRQEGDRHFAGKIDDVRIYNGVLSPGEVADLYDSYFVTPATIDIDPDVFNLKNEGEWVTCYIELPDGFDVGDIDLSTIAITEIDNTAVGPLVREGPTEIGDYDYDGIPDLMVKFDSQDLIAALQSLIVPPAYVEIKVAGNFGGALFEGSDVIKVISPGSGPQSFGEGELPVHVALQPVIPNPFNSSTVVTFSLPYNTRAKVCVYDTRGSLQRVLVDSEMNIGNHTVVWDGLSDDGCNLPNGVYFVKLVAGGCEEVQKVLFVR